MRSFAFSQRAETDLEDQIDYLIAQGALRPAEHLVARVDAFLRRFLTTYPRNGKYIADRELWETWVPGTRLVLWYRFTDDHLDVVRIWHASRDRDTG